MVLRFALRCRSHASGARVFLPGTSAIDRLFARLSVWNESPKVTAGACASRELHETHQAYLQCITYKRYYGNVHVDSSSETRRHRLVFLGTPNFSAMVLKKLFEASQDATANFEVVAVVSRIGQKAKLVSQGPAAQQPQATQLLSQAAGYHPSLTGDLTSPSPLPSPSIPSSETPSYVSADAVLCMSTPCTTSSRSVGFVPGLISQALPTEQDHQSVASQVAIPRMPLHSASTRAHEHILSHPHIEPNTSSSPSAAVSQATAGRGPLFWQPGMHITPVIQTALDHGLQPWNILVPENAKQVDFLDHLRSLKPDLCVTAAYGCILPRTFLDMPSRGTVNIHPSMLPLYRGAAPVQRCLMDGVDTTGVSLLYTVLRCDAGPVIDEVPCKVLPDDTTASLTGRLFSLGADMLLKHLPAILSGDAASRATPQDDSAATHAHKLNKEEGHLDMWTCTAVQLHNKVRALSSAWPWTRAAFTAVDLHTGDERQVELKVLKTRVIAHASQLDNAQEALCHHEAHQGLTSEHTSSHTHSRASHPAATTLKPHSGGNCVRLKGYSAPLERDRVVLMHGHMIVPCEGDTFLELVEVRHTRSDQQGSRRASDGSVGLSGKDFMTGLGRRYTLYLPHNHEHVAQDASP